MTELAPLVLIIEDEALIAMAYAQMLSGAGFRTMLAPTSALALAALGAERPAVAIVDLALRDGDDGRPVAEALASRGVPVVIASAHTFKPMPEFLNRVQPAAVLRKPFAPGRLSTEVRRAAQGAVRAPSGTQEAAGAR